MKKIIKIIFQIYLAIFALNSIIFSYNGVLSFSENSVLYSDVISYATEVSTKAAIDCSLESFNPNEVVYSNESKIATAFYSFVEYPLELDNPLLLQPTVSPTSGLPGQSYTFSVVYKDNKGDEPKSGYPKVRIFINQAEIVGSPFSLNVLGSDYVSGVLCSTTIVLNSASDKYSFYFVAYDKWDFYQESEIVSGQPVVNTPPQISWTSEAGYESDGVEPNFGDITTNFYFRIKYTDADNQPPLAGYPKVYILQGGTTIQILSMNYVTGVYDTGAIYSTYTKLNTGEYDYKFVAYDSLGFEANTLVGANKIVVSGPCQLEVVSYKQEVNPGEDFVVVVKYKSIGNYPPANGYPLISFYIGEQKIHQGVMEYISGSFNTGANYRYSVKFSTVSGNYGFVVSAMDSTGLWPITNTQRVNFVVSTPPTEPEDLTFYQDKNNNVVNTSKVTLRWKSVDTDENSKIVYELYFGDNPDNMKKIYEGENTEYTLYSLDDGKTYYWYVVAKDDTGRTSKSALFTFNTLDMQKDKVFNYPNPFKKGQKTNIVFYSDSDATAEIYICSLFGNVLFKDTIPVSKGSNIYEYDGSGLDFSGSYVVLVKINNDTKKGKILLLNK
jgi:hypothetical protein